MKAALTSPTVAFHLCEAIAWSPSMMEVVWGVGHVIDLGSSFAKSGSL